MSLFEKIQATANFISDKIKHKPEIGIILGSGLGGLIDCIEKEISIPYSEIPNFPVSTVQGHAGALVFGKMNGRCPVHIRSM